MNELDKLLSIAMQEEGYLEKKSNSQLDDKTANAGSNNYTKYARDFDEKYTTFYNGKKNGYAWCDVFVDWCFVQAFGEERARELLCQPLRSCGAGVGYSCDYYKAKGQFYSSNPKVGDQIFFKNSSGARTHTGLVYQVDANYVYTIEGNTSSTAGVVANGGCVRKKKYARNYKYIYGYGRPNYKVEPQKPTFSGKFPVLPDRGYFKKGDKGAQVIILQELLNYLNACNLKLDGDLGSLTEEQVRIFQQNNDLVVDGCFGKQSESKAIEIICGWKPGTYTVLKAKYVRKQPKVGNNKVKYAALGYPIKGLCTKDAQGYAKFKVGAKVNISTFVVDASNNIWGMRPKDRTLDSWLCVYDSTGYQVK